MTKRSTCRCNVERFCVDVSEDEGAPVNSSGEVSAATISVMMKSNTIQQIAERHMVNRLFKTDCCEPMNFARRQVADTPCGVIREEKKQGLRGSNPNPSLQSHLRVEWAWIEVLSLTRLTTEKRTDCFANDLRSLHDL